VVGEAESDIAPQGVEEAFDHLAGALGAVDAERHACAGRPAEEEEVREVGDVVGVHVGEDGGIDGGGHDAGSENPAGGAPAAVDEDVLAGGDDDVPAAAAVGAGKRAAGAEEDDIERLGHATSRSAGAAAEG